MACPMICRTLKAMAFAYPVATAQWLILIPSLIGWSCRLQDMKQRKKNRFEGFNTMQWIFLM
jgi:hypothetical protein